MNTIYLEPTQVPQHLRKGYAGKQFQAEVCETVSIPMTAGLWDGGSRDPYYGIDLASGAEYELPWDKAAPWGSSRRDATVTLQPGKAIVCHVIFCGKDHGLRFYVHPSDAAKLLPAPSAELTPYERFVLTATAGLKSSYMGKDRYQMARDDYACRKSLAGQQYPTRDQWDAAKQSLIGKGLLNRAGAITVAGRNAAKA
jgi:hypothetical protein